MSLLHKVCALAGTATIFFTGSAASADEGQSRVLHATATISLTIAPSAVVGLRSNERGAQQLSASGNGGAPLDGTGLNYTVRDGRGERAFPTLTRLQAALADATRRGEREIDVTFVF